MAAKSIWSIVNSVAWKYGIEDPNILEAGTYTPDAARVLRRMLKSYTKSGSEDSIYRYIEQKAKFIKAGKLLKPYYDSNLWQTLNVKLESPC